MVDAIAQAEARWGIHLKRALADEYVSACPFCGDGRDRFHVWTRGNYWCRVCDRKGFVDENETLTPEEIRLRKMEMEIREMQRRQEEQEQRLDALERIHREVKTAEHYHDNLDGVPGARDYWRGEGIPDQWQDAYTLGWCARCPTDYDHEKKTFMGRPSFTIPVWEGEELINIRHRLIGVEDDKYRPHLAGLGTQLFNVNWLQADTGEMALSDGSVILGEGEKKSIVAHVHGFPCVSISGARQWQPEWDGLFSECPTVYVCLDPDARGSAEKLTRRLGERARLVSLPAKLDDFFTKYGGTTGDLEKWLHEARPASCIGKSAAH